METIKLQKKNGAVIPCLAEIPDNPKGIVIMVHGFTSNKACATAELLFHRFPQCGLGVITYDQPGHGSEEAKNDTLQIENCKDSLACVEEYAAEYYPGKTIYYFSSSYGAYITGLYISTRPPRGEKAFFRSAAVIMPELILGDKQEPDPEVLEELDKTGYIEPDLGLGDIIRLPKGFFEDLQENDLFQKFDNTFCRKTDIEMVHGQKDPVVPVLAAQKFANEFGFKITVMEEEGHSICSLPQSPDRVADLALDFYLKK